MICRPRHVVFLLAGLCLPSILAAASAAPRVERILEHGWKFAPEELPGAQEPKFDDSLWHIVTLPHTWNAQDGADGGNNYRRGPSWYRLDLSVPRELAGKSFFLRFEGAATVADVFVNGTYIGHHAGNFGAFCFDVTGALKPGANNLLAVRVDNSHHTDVPPLSGDFTIFGGLYRPVHLLALDSLSISPLDYASPGVYWKQERITTASAQLQATALVRNADDRDTTARVRFVVTDRAGRTVHSSEQQIEVPAQTTTSVVQKINLPHPHLWNGRDDPYLYTAAVEVYRATSARSAGKRKAGMPVLQVADHVDQQIGLRFYHVDPNIGFSLNGKPYALHGVNRHQDRLNKGWAVSAADHAEDCQIILDMGCTAVRLAHYQHAQEFYDLCDKSGLVVWAELALVNKVSTSSLFMANARQQLTELIKQSYNHPSICFWSLFNELIPAPTTQLANAHPVAELNTLAHQLDATRPTTAASHLPEDTELNHVPDIVAINKYIGWNKVPLDQWGPFLDDLRTSYTGTAVGISEYGAGGSAFQHDVPTTKTIPSSRWHSEEWQALVHEAAWRAMKQRPWLWGTFVWNGFDFGVDSRDEGDQPGRNDKGLVTYDRKIKKDSYYFYQANWTGKPMVHIGSQSFTERPAGETTVTVYSNCDRVDLLINGRKLAEDKPDDVHVCRFENILLIPGVNRVQAIGHTARARASDEARWQSK